VTQGRDKHATDRPRRGEIHLGDLARALGSLGWRTHEQAEAIAACLGFGLGPAPREQEPVEVYNPAAQPRRPPVSHQRAQAPAPVAPPPMPQPPPPLPAHSLPSRLQPLPNLAPAEPDPDWLDGDASLLDQTDASPCARQTLFPEPASRHIFAAAVASWRAGDAVDVPRLIEAVARRQPLRALPRRAEPTLARGCQLLLDYSPAMVPFWDDLTDLIGQVGAVAGFAETRVYSFDTRPGEAVHWRPDGRTEPWKPASRPVLAASDLGIQGGTRATPHPGWSELAERCAAAGVPLLILIPWPESFWPKALGGRPELIHWSPGTSAGLIRRRLAAADAKR